MLAGLLGALVLGVLGLVFDRQKTLAGIAVGGGVAFVLINAYLLAC